MTNESEDALYEMAEQAWNECWPEEPVYVRLSLSEPSERKSKRAWLIEVFTNIVNEYDGRLGDIADHLGNFFGEFIDKRIQAILEDAKEAEAQARADSREDW